MVCLVIGPVLRLMRPKQWTKNLLVVAAPLAAGDILDRSVLAETALAFIVFCLASSATYCINDVLDAAADAVHPTKRNRPIPSGALSPRAAVALGTLLAITALVLAVPGDLRTVVAAYLAVTLLYSAGMKHQPVIELGLIAAGFILRAIGGGAATGIPLSQWFLIVTGFGSLFMVTGKRLSELIWAQSEGTVVRRTLAHYPLSYLRSILAVSSAVAIAGYCLWASEVAARHSQPLWIGVSVFPFVLALLRYGLDSDNGRVEEPEEVVFHDRGLQALAVLWLASYAMGVLR
jgi:decaprenyl-phosphate phosphoribosyltransferase